ncbi:hypothetical protein AgCh_007452 [Apium graveolens]
MHDDHISTAIWAGGVRDKLDIRQYTTNHQQWILSGPQRELLSQWGFSAFMNNRSVPQNNIRLITALVERWRPGTNTFHFPFGELTITLDDVYMIMGLPVKGRPVTHRELDVPKAYWMREWHDARLDEVGRKDMYRDGVKLYKLRERYAELPEGGLEQDLVVYTRAYLLYIIGGILFPSSSRYTVHPRSKIENVKEKKKGDAHRGARTHDHKVKSLALYQLS